MITRGLIFIAMAFVNVLPYYAGKCEEIYENLLEHKFDSFTSGFISIACCFISSAIYLLFLVVVLMGDYL